MVEPLEPSLMDLLAAPARNADDVVEDSAARGVRQMDMLKDLAGLGMDLARLVRLQAYDQAAALAADQPVMAVQVGADIGLTFTRIARCVRLSIALEARLDKDLRNLDREAAAEAAVATAARATRPAAERSDQARAPDAPEREPVAAEAPERELAATLAGRLRERLEDEEVDEDEREDWRDRPAADLVAEVCRELGVAMDWPLWRDGADDAPAASETVTTGRSYPGYDLGHGAPPLRRHPRRPATPYEIAPSG